MWQKILNVCGVVLLSLTMAGVVSADETTGKITKVGNGGREITIKAKDGKDVMVKISGSRTTLEGVKSRGDLKAGQTVMVEHDGDAAKKVKVTK